MTLAEIAARIRNGATVPCLRAGTYWCAWDVGTDDHLMTYGRPRFWLVRSRRPTCPACLKALGLAVPLPPHPSWVWSSTLPMIAEQLIHDAYMRPGPGFALRVFAIWRKVRARRRYRQSHKARR